MSASQQVGRRVHRRINVPALAFALAATLLATNFDAITGGRPKVLGDVQELARQQSPHAIDTLAEFCASH